MALSRDNAAGNAAPVIEREDLDGSFSARLLRVVDIGIQPRNPYMGVPKDPCSQIIVYFELPTEFEMDQDDNQRCRMVWEYLNLFKKAQRGKEVDWYAALDPAAVHGGDWGAMLGTPCTLSIKTNKKEDRKYFNIQSVAAPMKGIDIPELTLDSYVFDLTNPDKAVYERLADHVQKMITNRLTAEEMASTYEAHKAEREAAAPAEAPAPAGRVDPWGKEGE